MQKFLRATIVAGALFIIVVSLLHIALGQTWIPDTMPVTSSLDSEHRFYASLFLMYGLALLWVQRALTARLSVFHFLLLTLFVGGLARIVSALIMGWPHPMYIVLGALELAVPPLLWQVSLQLAPQRAS